MSYRAASRASEQGPYERSEWGCDSGESTREADSTTREFRETRAEAEAPRRKPTVKEAART